MLEPEFAGRHRGMRAGRGNLAGNQVAGLFERTTQWRSEKRSRFFFGGRTNPPQCARADTLRRARHIRLHGQWTVRGTAQRFGVVNLFDPAQNVEGGATYLRSLLDRYHGDLELTLAAYNAGPGAVERSGGVPNIRETRSYVQKVTDTYFRPGSGRDASFTGARRARIREDVDDNGRVVFTNE